MDFWWNLQRRWKGFAVVVENRKEETLWDQILQHIEKAQQLYLIRGVHIVVLRKEVEMIINI